MTRKRLLALTPVAAVCVAAMGMSSAAAAGSTNYQASLNSLNHSSGSGTLSLALNGSQATITEHVSGIADKFMNAPYPHVQHIHGGALGSCPVPSVDKNGDGVISTTEGAPSYGGVLTTLSTTGDTTPAAATNIKTAPSGGAYDYSRTITLDPATLSAVHAGTAVIVVHGLDPATLSKQAQGEKSDLVPSLPLAATSPTLCGKLVASQITSMPTGAVKTGGGSTSGIQDQNLYALSGGLLLAAGATVAARRRLSKQN